MNSQPQPRVLQLGPGLEVRGGVSSVEKLILEQLAGRIEIRHLATMEEGSPWRKLVVFSRAMAALRRELRRPGALLVHIHFASRGSTLRKWILASMTLAAHRPLILHAHGASFDSFFGRLPRMLQFLVRRVLRRADRLVVLSSQWRTFYLEHCRVRPERVVVLHNPVRPPPTVPDRARRQRVQLVFLGRIGARKGAFDLLAAFGALPPALRQHAQLVFAGDGEVEELRRQAAELGPDVTVLSWIDAQAREKLLQSSDVLVLPSHSEGLPMAMLEAMAHGLAVVVTPVGGIPDVVSDGVQGLLVPPGDIARLGEALRTLIEDAPQRLAMGRCARDSVRKFAVDTYGEELIKLYAGLLAEYPQSATAVANPALAAGLPGDSGVQEY